MHHDEIDQLLYYMASLVENADKRIVYKILHGTYKKALSKVLQTSSKSQKFINLLQKFIENKEIDEYLDLEDEFQQDHPPGTKRFKSTYKVSKLRLLAETRGFRQNGVRETAETSFAKSSRNAETAKPIKIAKLP
ncbi:hypothetical protein RhiirA4_468225 [Rhizophagus irregularis]|uniref:Uncharacterized protein n=1 Tax=Rhizophagus irregularis TaxID=588596 RepID=A0A2I1GXN7_9GLOM|nr:hypothetical protein RhiirA4_468225 [Rhizophagus irregularis]